MTSFVEKHCGSSLSSWLTVDTLLISKLFTTFVPICSQFRFYICNLGEFVKNKTHRFQYFSILKSNWNVRWNRKVWAPMKRKLQSPMKNAYSCNANVTIYRVFSCSYQKKILKLIEKKRKKEGERKKERKRERERKKEIVEARDCVPVFSVVCFRTPPKCTVLWTCRCLAPGKQNIVWKTTELGGQITEYRTWNK